jgi:hypothetical protein
MRRLVIIAVVVVALAGAAVADARPTTTVERQATCWKGTERGEGRHWAVWQPKRESWKHTTRPCKRLWRGGFAVIGPDGIAGFRTHRRIDLPEDGTMIGPIDCVGEPNCPPPPGFPEWPVVPN